MELDLRGRLAVVVGLGPVGRRRALGLARAGATVRGVDPAAGPGDPEGFEVLAEPYRAEHLSGAWLAVAAGPAGVNRQVVADARARGLLVNSAGDPGAGDFSVPAVWRRGGLTLTVSTSGASPALAAALRDRAADALGPEAPLLAEVLAALRPTVLRLLPDPAARRRVLADWADPRWLVLLTQAGAAGVAEELKRIIQRELGEEHAAFPDRDPC